MEVSANYEYILTFCEKFQGGHIESERIISGDGLLYCFGRIYPPCHELCRADRIDPDRIYKKAGFDASILKTPGARIPLDQFKAIWDKLEEEFPDPDLGLHVGETVLHFPGHILFLLMLNAPTLRDAIEKFCSYFNLMADFATPDFQIGSDFAAISIQFHQKEFPLTRNLNEGILSAYASVLSRISENKIRFKGVYFMHPSPRDTSEHHRIFGAPIFFDQAENRLVFRQ